MEQNALYNNIPPSLLRQGSDPFIESDINEFYRNIFDIVVKTHIKKRFFAIRVKNLEHYENRNENVANIMYAQHTCWWDGLIGYYLCRQVFKTSMRIMMEDLVKFPFFAKLGAFSVNKKSPKASLMALEYSLKILQNPEITLWLFPQGIIRPPDFRPIKFANGISYICEKIQTINLIPVAIKYSFLRRELPEVLVDVGKPVLIENDFSNRKFFTEYLEKDFARLLDNQHYEISNGILDNYETVYKMSDGLLKKFELFHKNK